MAFATCRTFWRAPAAVLLVVGLALLVGNPVGAAPTQSQISATEAQVANLEGTIAQEQQQSQALDAQYLEASNQIQQIQAALAVTQAKLAQTKVQVATDKVRLQKYAVNAYVFDTSSGAANPLFSVSPSRSEARAEYENAAVGNVTLAVNALNTEEAKLNATTALEQTQEQQANGALNHVHALQVANQNAAAQAQATLNQVRGTLATEVEQYAIAQAQAQAALAAANRNQAASAAASASQAAGVAAALGGPNAAAAAAAANAAAAAAGAPSASGSASGSAAGEQAVAAAESQLGVPYVWGGESPGVGFDCSGLTQWAWARAGVGIPRVASAQYESLPPVALNALQPGDLLFYYNLDGDNQIDHVVMYVGSGPYGTQTIIQAPYTGARVSYSPLFTEGLVAAGRP
jgi:cell wall-associated NlpC family hydrolase